MRKQNWEISYRYNTMHDRWIVKERTDLANYYNPYLKLRYNVTSTSEATPLIAETDLKFVTEIIIGGKSMLPVKEYTFATTGEHDVWFKFTDGAINYDGSGGEYVTGFNTITPVTEIVEIPTDLLRLTNNVFSGCDTLVKANLYTPNSKLNIITNSALNCVNLKEVIFPNSLKTINNSAFNGCKGLTELIIPNSVEIIQSSFSGCTNIERLVLSSSMTTIEARIWADNINLKEVIIPESIEIIHSGAFSGCTGLTELVIPNSITTIEAGTFANCSGLTKLIIPNSVTTIKVSAFYGCTGLTEITLPSTIIEVQGGAFSNCTGISKITSLATTSPIQIGAFTNVVPNGTLYIPYGCTEAYAECMRTDNNGYLGAQGWTIQELPKE